MWLVLLRVSSRGSKESSMSMTWTSVCIPRSSKVSKGLRVFAFFVAGALSSSSSVGAGDDSLDVLWLRAARLPVLRVREPGRGVLSTLLSESTGSGKGDGNSRGDDMAVVGPPLIGVARADAAGWPQLPSSWPPASSVYLARGKIVQEGQNSWGKSAERKKKAHTLYANSNLASIYGYWLPSHCRSCGQILLLHVNLKQILGWILLLEVNQYVNEYSHRLSV